MRSSKRKASYSHRKGEEILGCDALELTKKPGASEWLLDGVAGLLFLDVQAPGQGSTVEVMIRREGLEDDSL